MTGRSATAKVFQSSATLLAAISSQSWRHCSQVPVRHIVGLFAAYLHERVWQVTAYTAFLALMWGARVSDLIVLPLRLLASDARILLRQAAACLSTSDWQVQNGYWRGSCSTGSGFGGAGGVPRLISGFGASAARSVSRLGFPRVLDLAMRALRFQMPTGFFGMRLSRSDVARPTHLHLPQHVVDGSKVRNFGRLTSCSSSRALPLLGQC